MIRILQIILFILLGIYSNYLKLSWKETIILFFSFYIGFFNF